MTRNRPATRLEGRRVFHASLSTILLISIVALPICAVPCDEHAEPMPVMEGHDCCPAPCGTPEESPDDCGDDCLLQSDGIPADLPATSQQPQLVPVAQLDAHVSVPAGFDSMRVVFDCCSGQRPPGTTRLHILISQYLI